MLRNQPQPPQTPTPLSNIVLQPLDNKITLLRQKLKEQDKDVYDKIFASDQISEIKKNIDNARAIENSKLNGGACEYVAPSCAKGTFIGGAVGASTGVLAAAGAALIACLPLCCCAMGAACVRNSAFAQQKSSDPQKSLCPEDARDSIIQFIKDAANLVCDSRVALWGSTTGASIGGVAGTAYGYCEYKKIHQKSLTILDLLTELYRAYTELESSTQHDDALKKGIASPMMLRDSKETPSAPHESTQPLIPAMSTQIGLFSPPAAASSTSSSSPIADQKRTLST